MLLLLIILERLLRNINTSFEFYRITTGHHGSKAQADDDGDSDGDSMDDDEIRPLTQAELKKKIIKGVGSKRKGSKLF